MPESSALTRFVELARARLATGADHDDLLDLPRRHGLTKLDCLPFRPAAPSRPTAEVKRLVHHSPVRADRRETDERPEESSFRALSIDCLLHGGPGRRTVRPVRGDPQAPEAGRGAPGTGGRRPADRGPDRIP